MFTNNKKNNGVKTNTIPTPLDGVAFSGFCSCSTPVASLRRRKQVLGSDQQSKIASTSPKPGPVKGFQSWGKEKKYHFPNKIIFNPIERKPSPLMLRSTRAKILEKTQGKAQ